MTYKYSRNYIHSRLAEGANIAELDKLLLAAWSTCTKCEAIVTDAPEPKVPEKVSKKMTLNKAIKKQLKTPTVFGYTQGSLHPDISPLEFGTGTDWNYETRCEERWLTLSGSIRTEDQMLKVVNKINEIISYLKLNEN